MTGVVVLATARTSIADYLDTLISIYILLILAYIVSQMFFSFGGRVPYSRPLTAVLEFLRQVCEPFLSIFRRFVPMVGPVDLSPLVAVIVLQVVGRLVVNLIAG
jgi:YggT family protein